MINNESKFSQTLKKTGDFLIILMPIFSVGYFLWMYFSIPLLFYVSSYNEISLVGLLLLSGGYIFTIFALIYTKSISKSGIRIFGIIIFAFTVPLCCLNVAIAIFPYHTTVLDEAQISNTTYYLTGVVNEDGHYFRDLYKCKNNHFTCEKTPFYSGGGSSVWHWRLMIDQTTDPNEINVILAYSDGDEVLKYTYGAQPRYYDYHVQQLDDHLYYLAYYDNPEPRSTMFLLYECELDNTGCNKLPIQYKGFGSLRDMIADETTGEISVFIGDRYKMLIFTWGENPRCYVEGCEILEESE